MYIPPHFRQDDPAVLRAFIQRHSFALLSAFLDGRPEATHLPLLLREIDSAGLRHPQGVIVGHMARANPLWRAFDGERQALAVFHGPHAYISPRWYASRPQVPTWNFTAVHAYGAPRVVDNAQWFLDLLAELVDTNEAAVQDNDPGHERWSMAEEAEYGRKILPGTVAFEMPVLELQGKFKLNQNKSAGDRAGVMAGLLGQGDEAAQGVAALMRE